MRYRETFVRVDLGAIGRNLRALKAFVGTPLLAVVKADAYGHGLIPVARTAVAEGVKMLGVAIPEEGETLRGAGIDCPILVLGGVNARGAEASVRLGLTETVYDAEGVRQLQKACERLQKPVSVHIKLDTGMGRIGARNEKEIGRVLSALEMSPLVRLTGAFTHFADADGVGEAYSREQLSRFETLLDFLP